MKTAPKGALPYGADGPWIVWEHGVGGRTRWTFADEDLAMQFAVSCGSQVERNLINF